MKSLVNCKSTEDLVGELLVRFNTPVNAGKVAVWVEGLNWRVYRRFFDRDKIIEHGKASGVQILEGHKLFKEKRPNLHSVVIKDADFLRLEGYDMDEDPNVFYADGHDVEMMMMKQEMVREELCNVFELSEDDRGIFDDVFDDLKALSYFKWYDCRRRTCYSYKSLGKVQHDSSELRSLEWIENQVFAESKSTWDNSNHDTPFVRINPDGVGDFMNDNPAADRYEMTNGHDYINRLCLHIKNRTRYVRSEESLNDTLVASFKMDVFSQTNLHSSLRSWCDANVDIMKRAI